MMTSMATPMTTAIGARRSPAARVAALYAKAADLLQAASPLADLALRLYVANVFWISGLAKVQSWETTLQLFEYEYRVPLLPPALRGRIDPAPGVWVPNERSDLIKWMAAPVRAVTTDRPDLALAVRNEIAVG